MKPYYEHAGITIYHGDCREVMEEWEGLRTKSFDLLLTDPPYGIGEATSRNISRSNLAQARDYGNDSWDDEPISHDVMVLARRMAEHHIIFGGNFYSLPPTSCWLVWDKDNGLSDFADCELAWTNLKKAVRRLQYRWHGMLQEPGLPKEHRQHPTQKPEAVMRWCLIQAPSDVKTVLDPFMGSGTTLVAAKRLGRTAVGIELHEKYCEIAAKRLSQDVLPLAQPETVKTQSELW